MRFDENAPAVGVSQQSQDVEPSFPSAHSSGDATINSNDPAFQPMAPLDTVEGSDTNTKDKIEEVKKPWYLAGPPWPTNYVYVTPHYTLAYPIQDNTPRPPPVKPWTPTGPFPLMRLPAELRAIIFTYVLLPLGPGRTIDLDNTNGQRIGPRLALLRTSRQVFSEAFTIFYSRQAFRLFPTGLGYFAKRRPLLARLSPRVRAALSCLELRLGQGWKAPPKSWVVTPKLGLDQCKSVRTLKVFVEVDPSMPIFHGWRVDEHFFTDFCQDLITAVITSCPSIEVVEFDGFPSVQKDGPLMMHLMGVAMKARKRIVFGPERGWGRDGESDAAKYSLEALEDAMRTVKISA